MSRIEWYGRQLKANVQDATNQGMHAALKSLQNEYKRVVGVQGPPRSKPGRPPKKDTGFGQSQIFVHFDEANNVGYVGVTDEAAYMEWLDSGTRNIAPRPWIGSTFRKMIPKMQRVLAQNAKAAAATGRQGIFSRIWSSIKRGVRRVFGR